jgi:hypothetical protein
LIDKGEMVRHAYGRFDKDSDTAVRYVYMYKQVADDFERVLTIRFGENRCLKKYLDITRIK